MGKYDVVALGELLIDLTQNGLSVQGNPTLEANPGGAPCNVLALLSKLGHKTAFIGKVGQDGFGNQLEEALVETGISAEGLCRDKAVHTTLAVVHTFADGDRDFSFYRNPGADMRLTTEEVNMELIRQAKIFHFGTLSMTDEPVRSAMAIEVESDHGNAFLVEAVYEAVEEFSLLIAAKSMAEHEERSLLACLRFGICLEFIFLH